MKWIKKYWLAFLLYPAFCINVFLIQPGQQRFYLDAELERIDKISWHFSLIVAAILFALLLVYLLFTKLSGISSWGQGWLVFYSGLSAQPCFLNRPSKRRSY